MSTASRNLSWNINPASLERVPCNLCGADDTVEITQENSLNIVQCRRCGLVYVNPRPNTAELNRYYETYYSQASSKDLEITAEIWRRAMESLFAEDVKRIEQFVPVNGDAHPRKVLDIGCGFGFFLNGMKERGWDVHGCDLSANALRYAKEKFAINLDYGDFNALPYQPESFDAVTGWFLLEHVPNPKAIIQRGFDLLKPGGLMAVRMPNFTFQRLFIFLKKFRCLPFLPTLMRALRKDLTDADSIFNSLNPPEHLYGPTAATYSKLFESVGFNPVQSLSDRMIVRGNWLNAMVDFLCSNTTQIVRTVTSGKIDPVIVFSIYAVKPGAKDPKKR